MAPPDDFFSMATRADAPGLPGHTFATGTWDVHTGAALSGGAPSVRTWGAATPEPTPLALPHRYTWQCLLGRGGMGEVHRVHDRELDRHVALKVLQDTRALSPDAWDQFLREAQLTAGLQHPGIIPVYDLGTLPDGRAWYTMREVKGEGLGTDWRQPPTDTPSLRRRVGMLARVCEAVGYAHDHVGAVHRDLKPDNIMRGPFGEVLVVDWGLAVLTTDAIADGTISGTPAFMAPEQARGERAQICPATDVWALGAMLVAAITGRPPHVAPDVRTLLQHLRDNPPPPTCPTTDPDVQSLWRIVHRALQPAPTDRFASASLLGASITAWLDGSERRADALDHVRRADDADQRARQLRARSTHAQSQATAGLTALPKDAPEADRAPFWALEDRARTDLDQAQDAEDEATHLLRSALVRSPGLTEAMTRLADRFQRAHAAAEARTDHRAARRLLAELRAHDTGQHAHYIRGGGRLTLRTNPPGARVIARQYVQRGRRRIPADPIHLGTTPLQAVHLPHGSWSLTLEAPGRAPGILPIVIRRGAHVGADPTDPAARPIPLPRAHRLGPHDVYLPPGWFIGGGAEPTTDQPLPRQHLFCPPLIARRHPFTLQEALAWFGRLHQEGQLERALTHCPRMHGSTPGEPEGATIGIDPSGSAILLPDQDGDLWDPRWPAIMVTWGGAVAITEDHARWDGLPWRLPGELEWAWMARGADGRVFPWGTHHLEPGWCRMRDTSPVPIPAPVADFPIDCSPAGIRGTAGNVIEWCAEDYPATTPTDEHSVLQAIVARGTPPDGARKNARGGAYYYPAYSCRSTLRRVLTVERRSFDVGFRMVRSLVPEDLA